MAGLPEEPAAHEDKSGPDQVIPAILLHILDTCPGLTSDLGRMVPDLYQRISHQWRAEERRRGAGRTGAESTGPPPPYRNNLG
jgi:hypothetical protein